MVNQVFIAWYWPAVRKRVALAIIVLFQELSQGATALSRTEAAQARCCAFWHSPYGQRL